LVINLGNIAINSVPRPETTELIGGIEKDENVEEGDVGPAVLKILYNHYAFELKNLKVR